MQIKSIQFKRGPEERRGSLTPADGEPLWVTTPTGRKLFVGDGVTAGGLPVTNEFSITGAARGSVVIINNDEGTEFISKAPADLLADYMKTTDARSQFVLQSQVDSTDGTLPDKIPTNGVVNAKVQGLQTEVDALTLELQGKVDNAVTQAMPSYLIPDNMNPLGYRRVYYGDTYPSNPKEGDIFISL